MPSNPNNPRQRRARTNKGTFVPDDPSTPDVNEAWVDIQPEPIETTPRRKPAGKPTVKNQVAKPKIGAVDKVRKPTFGVVRGVYN
jgi:hypothetical protein